MRLNEDKKGVLAEKKELESQRARLAQNRELFQEYDYDAHRKYQAASEHVRESGAQLERLKKAQEKNQDYLELSELAGRLSEEQNAVHNEYNAKLQERSGQEGGNTKMHR